MKSILARNGISTVILVTGLLAVGASTARAGSISYENFFDWTQTNFFTQSLTFPQFSGTGLTSVTLAFLPEGTGADSSDDTAMETAGSLTNGSETAFANFGVQVTFLVGSSPFSGIDFTISSPTLYNGVLTGGQVVTWTNGQTFTKLTPSSGSTQTISCPNCSAFIGLGNVTIADIEAFGGYSGTFPTNYTQSATTSGEAIAEITYNFDVVNLPEPTTQYLIGSALIGFSFLMARRRRQKQS